MSEREPIRWQSAFRNLPALEEQALSQHPWASTTGKHDRRILIAWQIDFSHTNADCAEPAHVKRQTILRGVKQQAEKDGPRILCG